MLTQDRQYFIIADAHLSEENDSRTVEFFEMLERIGELPSDCAVIFLGDIFELWVALKRYETPVHRRFLDWSKSESKKRTLIFIEGNHEFYVVNTRRSAFTKVTSDSIMIEGVHFAHGDRINRADYGFALLRFALRNPVTRFLGFLFGPFCGPLTADKIRLSLKNKNMKHKGFLPENHIADYMSRAEKKKIERVILGHFHQSVVRSSETCTLDVVPAFQDNAEIACFLPSETSLKVGNWKYVIAT